MWALQRVDRYLYGPKQYLGKTQNQCLQAYHVNTVNSASSKIGERRECNFQPNLLLWITNDMWVLSHLDLSLYLELSTSYSDTVSSFCFLLILWFLAWPFPEYYSVLTFLPQNVNSIGIGQGTFNKTHFCCHSGKQGAALFNRITLQSVLPFFFFFFPL